VIGGATAWAWVPVTLAAAAAQTARNATQTRLAGEIGLVGATQARFLFGLPFALAFLPLALRGGPAPALTAEAAGFVALGAAAQIAATALMLAAMRGAGLGTVTALLKTEPALAAGFGLALLGEAATPAKLGAIALATAGALTIGWRPGGARAAATGVAAGALFGLSAVAFRGAILGLEGGDAAARAATALAWALGLQSAALAGWMAAFDRRALAASLGAWRASLAAGFLGALASQLWFLGFALTSAANVRTLALVEAPLAALVGRRAFGERPGARWWAGAAMIAAGAAWLIGLAAVTEA
jgi:drug/metabolite transporter (DMT)-like permease